MGRTNEGKEAREMGMKGKPSAGTTEGGEESNRGGDVGMEGEGRWVQRLGHGVEEYRMGAGIHEW